MKEWAHNSSLMNYWIPDTALCPTIDAVEKFIFPHGTAKFYLLQLTKISKFCFIALLDDKKKMKDFRLQPVEIKNKKAKRI
ncbi:hypothetical protein THRCLA_20896 [Thraustotheca clavata]|uniref:Crinkler (CRN) family protein n=1 Tax=Thraustotheca clavata TaxID=74557 RepID=A0A1W0A283_9STRA|nr:hypothetical protein THRCLA_20896 [Thraustotheca clavata]